MSASIWNPNTQLSPALPAVAPVAFIKGSAAVPGITFVGDADTGVWSQANGYINFSVNGVNVLTIDPAGNLLPTKLAISPELAVPSATTVDLGSVASNAVNITGTNNIASLGVNYNGPVFLRFTGSLTLQNSAALMLPGGQNITTAAGDTCIAVPKATAGVSDGWQIVGYSRSTVVTSEWQTTTLVPLYISPTSFSIAGDQTGILIPGRRVQTTNLGGTVYSVILTSVFSGGVTTCVVVNDSGVLDASLSAISYGLLNPLHPSVPQSASAIAALGLTSRAFVNRIINGGFTVNQRSYVSGVALAAGAYGHDRWKAGAGGCTYTYAAGAVGVPYSITITAGTLQQVIEGRNLPEGGTYVLQWTGSAQARIGAGAYQGSPLVVSGNVAGANTTVEFGLGTVGGVQFELGNIPSPTEQRDYESEFQLCRVYCQQLEAIGGTVVDTTHVRCPVTYITPMRGAGTITLLGTPTFFNPVGGGGVASAVSLASAAARSSILIFTVSTMSGATAGMSGYIGGPVALITNEL